MGDSSETETRRKVEAQQLREFVVSSAFELFSSHGINVRHRDGAAPPEPRAAIELSGKMEFMWDGFRGEIALHVPREFTSRTYPVRRAINEAQARDWLAELVNRLFGRFKNRCSRAGIHGDTGLPDVSAATLLVAPVPADLSLHLVFSCGDVDVLVTAWMIWANDRPLFNAALAVDTADDGSVYAIDEAGPRIGENT